MPRRLPCGEHAVLLECADVIEALARHAAVWHRDRPDGLLDAVPGARTLLLVAASAEALEQAVAVATRDPVSAGPAHDHEAGEVEVPVWYDGPDLDEVARLTGLRPHEVVRAHTREPWRVGFGGFAPGFAYLTGGDSRLAVPRREQPRPRVEAGSVGLAGPFCGIYPRSSPGGWQLIGRTDVVLWDLGADPPALLRPGMTVRFVEASEDPAPPSAPVSSAKREDRPASGPEHAADRSLEVLDAGPLTLVQDLGRRGVAAMGVSPSGAADRSAHALGARLLGQDPALASLECFGGGLTVRARGAVSVVLTGAVCPAAVDGVPVGFAAPFLLPDGAVLRLGVPRAGLRTYVTVSGGVDVPPVLGSRSRDTLSGIGPEPLRAGQVLPVGRPAGTPLVDVAPVEPPSTGPLVLGVTPGPRLDWLAHARALVDAVWSVSHDSDRVGVRLAGPAIDRAGHRATAELPSEGVVRGGVQVPPDGRPVVFLADHPVTGGYPVVAVLDDRSVDRLAQAVPGQQVRFRWA